MNRALRVLMAEDNAADAELILYELRKAGFKPEAHRVETEKAFRESLNRGWDIILVDYSMPSFNGLRALQILVHTGLEAPCILVSGSIAEDVAIAAMKEGAADYVLKDRLARLGPAVRQALEKSGLEKARRQSEE